MSQPSSFWRPQRLRPLSLPAESTVAALSPAPAASTAASSSGSISPCMLLDRSGDSGWRWAAAGCAAAGVRANERGVRRRQARAGGGNEAERGVLEKGWGFEAKWRVERVGIAACRDRRALAVNPACRRASVKLWPAVGRAVVAWETRVEVGADRGGAPAPDAGQATPTWGRPRERAKGCSCPVRRF